MPRVTAFLYGSKTLSLTLPGNTRKHRSALCLTLCMIIRISSDSELLRVGRENLQQRSSLDPRPP